MRGYVGEPFVRFALENNHSCSDVRASLIIYVSRRPWVVGGELLNDGVVEMIWSMIEIY